MFMVNNWRQLMGLAAMLALAVAGLAYRWHPPAAAVTGTTISTDTMPIPDVVLQQPLLETFDDNGKRSRQILGHDLQYFSKPDQSIISMPKLEFHSYNKNTKTPNSPWLLQADTAMLTPKKDDAELQGNVVLQNTNPKTGNIEIRTERLRVNTLRQFAETDKAVTIRGRRSEVRSIGLQADLASEHLLLTSRVKEIHEVAKRL
jgi:LPS export ABC transporter protein LptC